MDSTVDDGIRPQDWAQAAFFAAAGGALWSLVSGRRRRALRLAGVAVAADVGSRWLSRRHPSPFRARFRFALVHPPAERRRLMAILAPEPGERIIEIGPGAGHHAVDVAGALGPDGRLDVLDIQSEMLEATAERARAHGVENVIPSVGDACARLPYDDDAFDAAYLSGVLGELPEPDATLRELRRVVKTGGRLVVGEVLLDPDFVPLATMRRRADAAGFTFERRDGSPAAFYARFRAGA